MHKTFLATTSLVCVLFTSACSETEMALMDQPDQTRQSHENAPEKQATTTQKAPIKDRVTERDAQDSELPSERINQISPKPIPAAQSAPAPVQPRDQLANIDSVARTPLLIKRCMNLGNALEAPNEGEWGYSIRARDLQTIKSAGFDTIRLPVRWDSHTANRAPYTIDPAFMTRVKTVVNQAGTQGLGVIIDVHHYDKLMTQTRRQEARFLAIWRQISEAFKDAPPNIYFEILNEPTLDITMEQVNALYAKTIPVIRTNHPTRKIIIGGNSWNSVETMSKVNWPNDPNIVATFHDYGPHAFTHQGAEWSEPKMPLGRRWGGQEDANELKSTYEIASAFRAKTGLPILVGEFGVIDKVPQPQRMQWTKIRRQTMEANNMAWCAWDFSGAFKTYDIATEQWLPGVHDALFGR